MAKRTAKKKTIAVFSGDKGETTGNGDAKKPGAGKGKKYCPHCSKIIGAANSTCPECGKKIKPKNPKKAKAGATRKGASFDFGANVKSNGTPDPLSAAASLIEASGGLAEARAVLDRLAAIAKLC